MSQEGKFHLTGSNPLSEVKFISFKHTFHYDDDEYILRNKGNVQMAIQGLLWDKFGRPMVESIWGLLDTTDWVITILIEEHSYCRDSIESNNYCMLVNGYKVIGATIAITF